jgi:hypothetical protein
MKSLAPVHFRALLRLADRYDHDDFVAAATKAQDFKRFDANAVERILERDYGPGDHDTTPLISGLGPLIVGDVDQGDLDAYAHLDSLNDQDELPEDTEPATHPDKDKEES